MNFKQIAQLASSIVLGGVLMASTLQPALGHQQDQSSRIIPSLSAQQADVRQILSQLFKFVGASYTVAPDVQGTVTFDLKNVTFESALQNITRQVQATYRVDGGVYQVIRREVDGGLPIEVQPTPGGESGITAVQDGTYLYVISGSTIYKVRKSDLSVTTRKPLR